MSDDKLNRRDFFKRAAAFGAIATGAGAFLSACEKKGDGGGGGKGGGGDKGGGKKADKGGGAKTCKQKGGSLTDTQKKFRKQYKYVAETEKPDQTCDNCAFYKPGATDQKGCGNCTLNLGNVPAKAWCDKWQKKKG